MGERALLLVREFVMKGEPMTLDSENREIVFGNVTRIRCGTRTSFINSLKKSNYTLDQIWLFATRMCGDKALSIAEYVHECQVKKVDSVEFRDRADLKKFLTGEVETQRGVCDSL